MCKVIICWCCWDKVLECEMPSSNQATWWGYIKSKRPSLLSIFLLFLFPSSWSRQHVDKGKVVEQHCHLVFVRDKNSSTQCRERSVPMKSCCIIHALFLNYAISFIMVILFRVIYIFVSLLTLQIFYWTLILYPACTPLPWFLRTCLSNIFPFFSSGTS